MQIMQIGLLSPHLSCHLFQLTMMGISPARPIQQALISSKFNDSCFNTETWDRDP